MPLDVSLNKVPYGHLNEPFKQTKKSKGSYDRDPYRMKILAQEL